MSEPLIRLSRVLTEPDLLELVREPQARPSVARRLNLTEPVARVVDGVLDEDAELLSSAMNAAYQEGTPIPGEILVRMMNDHDAG